MKKMLFITPKLPFPAIGGALVGTLSSLKFLPKIFQLDVITFIDEENEDKEKYISELKKLGINNVFFVDYKIKKRTIPVILKSIFQSIPMGIYRNECSKMKNLIEEISANYDFIYADLWVSMQFIPENYKGKKILKEHDAVYVMWERLYHLEKNPIKKLYLLFELNKIKKYESMICNKANNVLVVTYDDKESLRKIGANENKITMLPGIIMNETEYKNWDFNNKENSIIFVGNLNWSPNLDGVVYFIKNIYPKIKQKVPDIKFYIVGSNPSEILKSYSEKDNSVIITGFVEDLNEYYNKAKISVVYLRYGSGIKIKILDALASGMPVISNNIGLEGIHCEGTLLCENDEDFSQKTIEILNDTEKLKYMSKKGYEYIKKSYSEKEYYDFFSKISGEAY